MQVFHEDKQKRIKQPFKNLGKDSKFLEVESVEEIAELENLEVSLDPERLDSDFGSADVIQDQHLEVNENQDTIWLQGLEFDREGNLLSVDLCSE